MEVLATIISFVKGLFSGKIDSSRSPKVISGQNSGSITQNTNSNNHTHNETNNYTHNETVSSTSAEKKSPVNTLKSWMSDLEKGEYKTHAEVVNLFCRHVIPFIQSHPDLQVMVDGWRTKYKIALLESERLQKEVLQDSEQAFRAIVQAVGETSEQVKGKIADIEDILAGERRRVGYTSWSLYWEVYSDVKELLEMLLTLGKRELCSHYAVIGETSKYYEDDEGKGHRIEPYIVEFTFAPTVERAVESEKAFDPEHVQEPFLVWKYFETALHFWEVKDADMEQDLNSFFKTHPFKALGTRGAWAEIAQAKRDKNQKEALILKRTLFMKGLRTLINEITTLSETSD